MSFPFRRSLLAALLTLTGCTDRELVGATANLGRTRILAELQCTGSPRTGTIVCREAAASPGIVSRAVLSQGQVKLTSKNVTYNSATQIFGFDVNLKNLMGEAIGTVDGVTLAGSKVFYSTAPHITSYVAPGDTGTISVANADGVGNFTGPNQSFYLYDQILQPQDSTPLRRWELRMPLTVNSFSFAVKVFTWMPSEAGVPARAPDGVPAWFYAADQSIPCSGIMAGPCLRNVVGVSFHPAATAEERQSALNAVNGVVVGGHARINRYYVKLAGDSTSTSLVRNAMATLRAMPQVARVHPFGTARVSLEHRLPYDSTGWRDWKMDPDSANGTNWAFERVAAPYAWGCSTGDASRVAVVDHDFHSVSDVMENVTVSNRVDAFADTVDHGHGVAAALAAHGNDSSFTTGMMWRADMRLYEASTTAHYPTSPEIWVALDRAASAGARVINLSVGVEWPDLRQTPGYNPATETDTAKVRENLAYLQEEYGEFREVMDTLAAHGIMPLVVFSAGNEGIDAKWNMARVAVDSIPNQVLVVGASDINDGLASFSNRGSLVQVTAPGHGVYLLFGDSTIKARSGTSFAAPLVTGTAGLLLAFDSTLSAGDLKQAIIQGAIRGGRTAGGIPILNAHESLKFAAERTAAPLCGNRLWVENNAVKVRRSGGAAEALFAVSDHVRDLQVLHGGKQVRFWDGVAGTSRLWRWTAGSWAEQTVPPLEHDSVFGPGNDGPVYRAYWGVSHDGDSIAWTRSAPGGFLVEVADMPGFNWTTIRTFPLARAQSLPHQCVRRWTGDSVTVGTCTDSAGVGSTSSQAYTTPAYSPRGDRIYVAVTSTLYTSSVGGSWTVCPGQDLQNLPDNHRVCRDHTSTQSMGPSTVYYVHPVTGTPTVYATVSGHVFDIVPGDGGQELAMNVLASYDSGCTVQYRNERTGTLLASTSVSCESAPTFAPDRASVDRPSARKVPPRRAPRVPNASGSAARPRLRSR